MLWWEGNLVSPAMATSALPHVDMPDEVKVVYEEAREIFQRSPRAAAALLRLAIQILCGYLGQNTSNLNSAIGGLVKDGLPNRVQKALDTVRVVGNNAVHPGLISVNDDEETATALFALINYVVERLISEPAKIDQLFESLPETAKMAIKQRDGKKHDIDSAAPKSNGG
ncbi:DUF4145 domain-containing protein [Sphingorhabdus sp.]|uniref:DUF4145 domain-containing protein n=1 Tax=Sphingorhabdus sp. TaxID=1902408 RepID=UPI003BAEB7EF